MLKRLADCSYRRRRVVDATIVRLVVVPATIELLGDRNWWLPRWLDRILPRIHVEAPSEDLDTELDALTAEAEAPAPARSR